MMPGIAIQPGLPIAGAPPVRNTSAAGGNRFSDALHGTPKDADRAEDAAGRTVKQQDGDEEKKVDRSARPKDERDDTKDEDTTKKDDRTGNALPPHMQAERTLARQWSDDAPATTGGSASAGKPDGRAVASAPASGATEAAAAVEGATAGKMQASALRASAMMEAGKAGQIAGKDNGPAVAGQTISDPALKDGSIVAVTAVDTGKATSGDPSAAFMARITALRHGADPATPKADAASATDPDANATPKIVQISASQNFGNAGADADGQGGGDGDKTAQNAGQPTSGAKGNASATPLPTAQMFPVSGSATSFAGALVQGGALARYASAAAATAAGVPGGSLPGQSLSIQLRPVELGAVTANLKYAGSGLTIDIQVETTEAHRRLSNDSSDIVKSLQSLGFQVDKVTVRQALAQPQSQGQAQGQPMGRDGSAAGFAGQGGAQSSMSGQSGAGGHRQDTENRHDQTADRGVGMVQQTADRLPRRGVFI
jgi:chemotaxis protein MotD